MRDPDAKFWDALGIPGYVIPQFRFIRPQSDIRQLQYC